MLSELFTIGVMAVALSMDAFSISLGLGLLGINYRRIIMIGLAVGFFHGAMPLIGMFIGNILSYMMGTIAHLIGGSGLMILGCQMVLSTFQREPPVLLSPRGFGLLLFSISVSIDSFSVGLSLGMIGVKTWMTVLTFAAFSALFTWAGLVLGKKVGPLVGNRSAWIGGFILVYFGVKMIMGA